MGRKKKSLAEYINDLNHVKDRYRQENIDLNTIRESFNTNRAAKTFLNKNESNHPRYDEYKQSYKSTLEDAKKHIKINNLEQKIRNARRNGESIHNNVHDPTIERSHCNEHTAVEPTTGNNNDIENTTSESTNHRFNDDTDENESVNDTIREASARMFLILYERFAKLFNQTTLEDDEYETIAQVDISNDGELYNMFEWCGKEDIMQESLRYLEQLSIINSDDDITIHGEHWYNFWHFHIIHQYIENNQCQQQELFNVLNDKLKNGLRNSLSKYARDSYFYYRFINDNIIEYNYGSNHEDLHKQNWSFFDRYNIYYMEKVLDLNDSDAEIEDVMDKIQATEIDHFNETIQLLNRLGILNTANGIITKGSRWYNDNERWLEENVSTQEQSELNKDQCQNCKRHQFTEAEGPYILNFRIVSSKNIRRRCKFKHLTSFSGMRSCKYVLCEECHAYLVKKDNHPKNIWPTYFWNLLTGHHSNAYEKKYAYNTIYKEGVLWRFIPKSMRLWWINEVRILPPYQNCTTEEPPPIFEDKTCQLKQFEDDFNTGLLAKVVDAMKNEDVINKNVLCPWSCTTSCRRAGKVPLDIIIQRMLLKVNIPLYSDAEKYNKVQSSWNMYYREDDDYDSILLNDKWKIKPSLLIDEDGIHVLTCKYHDGGNDKLTFYTPRCPNKHIFNAEITDQLSHCVKMPRISKPMKANKYNTTFAMVQCQTCFSGVDTMNIGTHSNFGITSELLSQHEDASIVGRPDMTFLLDRKVNNNEISKELAESYIFNAKQRYTSHEIEQCGQGATYVGFEDIVRIHLFESSEDRLIKVNIAQEHREDYEINIRRSWPILINILQTEDQTGYGTQFRSIPKFQTTDMPSAVTWSIFAIMSSCKELWHIIDSYTECYDSNGWEGWILSSIYNLCFQYDRVITDKKSPFKKVKNLSSIVSKVNKYIHPDLNDNERDDAAAFYKFDEQSINNIFSQGNYSSHISVVASLDGIARSLDAETRIIIYVGRVSPTEDTITIGTASFELKVVCNIRSKRKTRNASKYDAIRYMRHGNGFTSWWKQERSEKVVTKCNGDENIFQQLFNTNQRFYFSQFIMVYVKKEDTSVDDWRTKLFKNMGGKAHVQCHCCNFPLIPSYRSAKNKSNCNVEICIDESGNQTRQQNRCQRKESYICSNSHCCLRICNKCYNHLPLESTTTVYTSHTNNDDSDENNEIIYESETDDDSHASNRTNESIMSNSEDLHYVPDNMDNFILNTEQDFTLDTTDDNLNNNEGFITTDAGDTPANIFQADNSECISGHVIFNQVGTCTSRNRHIITGTSRQRHFIQSLCATSKGQPSPLLQPEASLFPRHFFMSATNDKCSILGAQPVFLLTSKNHPYGFASTLSQARIHMTNASSTTSTDMVFMTYYFDMLGNKLLNCCHSRDLFERGFMVDNESSIGMSIRDKGCSDLSESVDSRKMVMNLSSSQKYINYTWFLTFTANHSLHPGLSHLHNWKESMQWTKKIRDYDKLSPQHKSEMKKGMEHAYGSQIYENWNAVKYLLLKHIKQHLTVLGTVSALLGRDEYQKNVGNLSHGHVILAIEKRTVNNNSESYIQDLIRTSTMELIRTDVDLERLVDNGLLKSVHDIPKFTELAATILKHICDDRCKMRIGDGETEENFKCRKMHPVKDNPDPTQHSYVRIPYKYQKHTLDVLEEIGMYIPPLDESSSGKFSHPYFEPKRHIAPCNVNATCNMSPVIPDFFLATQSMQNAQALENTNGTSKYVCKYLGKFDEGNYVVLCQDIHTGHWVLGKTHLHNTKIVTSKFNEDKAFAKERTKNHPKGRDMAHFEIRQILMGDPEVFTNMKFIQISTLPFELRPTNKVDIDDNTQHPPDSFSSEVPSQQARNNCDLQDIQMMTDNQKMTYRNNDGKTAKYCMISVFSLRPPELLKVFRNPVDYFRLCYIDEKQMSTEEMENVLSPDLSLCPWIDCLGRRIRLRKLGLREVAARIQKNIEKYNRNGRDTLTEEELSFIEMNEMVDMMITVYLSSDESLSLQEKVWRDTVIVDFIHVDNETLLPIPVLSHTSPSNAFSFLIHIVLSLGEYDTEIDALSHPTSRECLRKAGLIGDETDESSLKKYAQELSRHYIEEQLVFFPNSLSKSEIFIIMAKRVFDDAILYNELAMNELPPFTMLGVRASKIEERESFWKSINNSQLQSCYSTLCNATNIPPIEDMQQVNRESPLQWDPLQDITQYENQTLESFNEQKESIDLCMKQIRKYRTVNGHAGLTYTKNSIVYGAPGTGKSFVCQYVVLYCISQGLNVISSALMGVRANVLGGIHLHKIFFLPTDNKGRSPFVCAEDAIQRIERKPEIHFAIMTLDVLFIDEVGQVSANILAIIEIILRKLRQSQTPFGGVLIFSSLDHTQLQPINELPFLTSSLMMTCFQAINLQQSVRAHGDPDFQRLQAITRMNPYFLMNSQSTKEEFFSLASRILTFVPNWEDNRIGPNMMRTFSRIRPTQDSLNEFRESIKRQLCDEGIEYRIALSKDSQQTRSTRAEFYPASPQSIKSLNRELKEPTELVFFVGGIYECTINDPRSRYSQSQLAYMLDLPTQDVIDKYASIPLWIAPPGTHYVQFNHHTIPTRENLMNMGWVEVNIGTSPERIVVASGSMQAKRMQYSLKHIGATTINKSQGATLPLGLAVEITKEYAPWEKGQIVVCLSRTTTSDNTIIVGEKDYAIKKMWELITIATQWTRYTEHVLKAITINNNDENTTDQQAVINYPEVYPFRICDSNIPTDTTGFVYCLVSVRHTDQIYIGQTKCLAQRLGQHNRGTGARGTHDLRYIPWGVAAYISGLSHLSTIERMSLERDWKLLVEEMRSSGQNNTYLWINAGSRIVEAYNEGDANNNILFVCCVTQDSITG